MGKPDRPIEIMNEFLEIFRGWKEIDQKAMTDDFDASLCFGRISKCHTLKHQRPFENAQQSFGLIVPISPNLK
jgi:hypothetical protein